MLTAAEFQKLADVPPEVEWFANLTNAHTRRAYENAVKDFMRFTGIERPEEFRTVTRAHVIAWRDDLKTRPTRHGEPWSDASMMDGPSACFLKERSKDNQAARRGGARWLRLNQDPQRRNL